MSATLIVNITAIKQNIERIKSLIDKDCKYCFVAKANCYGLGIEICRRVETDVDIFAVSSESEFLALRKLVSKPILILDPVYENLKKLICLDAIFTISNLHSLNVLNKAAKQCGKKAHVFLALNTGMNRFGFCDLKSFESACAKIKKTQNITVLGVFSHYFDTNNENFSKNQLLNFNWYKPISEKFFGKNLIYSISSTGGIYLDTLNMARIGIGNYTDAFFDTLKFKSEILEIQTLEAGDTAGYNAVFKAKRKTKLAVVGVGYGDGLPRRIFGVGKVLVRGMLCDIVAVCMDSILVNITDVPAKISDEVVIIGRSKNKQIFICDVAKWCDTIVYEIIVNISARVKRVYVEEKPCRLSQENIGQEN